MIVWLASYPRSGNTFLRVILNNVFKQKTYSLYDDKLDIAADRKTAEIVGHEMLPEDFSLEEARACGKCYFIKTHDKPPDVADKAIYLVRDGREATLSYRNYLRSFSQIERDLLDIAHGNVRFGSWGEHVYRWAPLRRANTLLIRFETLIEDPREYVDELAGFTGLVPEDGEIPEFGDLHEINPAFFRSGKRDSWRKEYTAEQHESFWLMNCSSMIELGYSEFLPEILQDEYLMNMISRVSLERVDRACQIKDRHQESLDKKHRSIELLAEDIQKSRVKTRNIKRRLEDVEMNLEQSRKQLQECNLRRGDLEIKLQESRELQDRIKIELLDKHRELEQYSELGRRIKEMQNTVLLKRPFDKYRSYKAVMRYYRDMKKS